MQTRVRHMLRISIILPALALLASCQPPPYAKYVLLNSTGTQIEFEDCNNKTHRIEPDATSLLVDRKSWGVYIKCAFKDGLTVRTEQNTVWFYEASTLKRHPDMRYVYGNVPYSMVPYGVNYSPLYNFEIMPDGSIALGRFKVSPNSDPKGSDLVRPNHLVNEFDDDQPPGFPIMPASPAVSSSFENE